MNLTINQTTTAQTWNDSFLLNIEIIDKQHKRFFEIFDTILLLSKKEGNEGELSNVINELQEYAHFHFQTEEDLIQKANAPNSDLHIIQHEFFIRKIKEFRMANNYSNPVLINQIVIFMRKWLLMHISEVDGKYVESVQQFLLKDESK
ncbi:MAG: hemerythrin family protein [Paludibacter sp.]|jgi:hemerythrin|nr:hemerythrin family protein [Paludibacter sp.]